VSPTEIALTDSTTMGLGLLYGGLALKADQEILTTTSRSLFDGNLAAAPGRALGRHGAAYPSIEDLRKVTQESLVETLVKAVRPRTRIVAVTWVHSSTGLSFPLPKWLGPSRDSMRSRADEDRVILCVDGVHALGVEDFRLSEVGCDFLIAGTHKWMFGPRGTGLVWGHPRAWPLAQAIIPTFDTDAYDMWMRVIPPRPLLLPSP
jgi:selenocysteine lyase/cysteine desulfurase